MHNEDVHLRLNMIPRLIVMIKNKDYRPLRPKHGWHIFAKFYNGLMNIPVDQWIKTLKRIRLKNLGQNSAKFHRNFVKDPKIILTNFANFSQ